jgi:hypothetical protein
MCSILCWILSIWEALGWKFCVFGLIHALSIRGRSLILFWANGCILEGFQVVSSHFWASLHTGLTDQGHRSDRLECWPCSYVGHRSDRWWWPVWPIRAELMQLLYFHQVVCMHSSRVNCIGSGGACICAAGALCGFRALVGDLCSLLQHGFVSDVSSRCPCLRGPRLVFFKWSCSLPFVRLSISCWSFFLFVYFHFIFSRVTICGCCQCTHQGGDWGPCVVRGPMDGRFLVWWEIDNVVWTDSWLSIAGAG